MRGTGRRPWGRLRATADAGSAVVEFCLLAVLMLLPVVYLVVTLGRLQAASFATQGAAREAARAFVTAQDEGSGRQRADVAAEIAFTDQGFDDPAQLHIDLRCVGECLAPDSRVVVHAWLQVPLPAVPRLIDRAVPAHVTVDADHAATVDRFGTR